MDAKRQIGLAEGKPSGPFRELLGKVLFLKLVWPKASLQGPLPGLLKKVLFLKLVWPKASLQGPLPELLINVFQINLPASGY